jgi:hypothetical protein
MTNPRSISELVDFLDKDSSWRKKEIASSKWIIDKSTGETRRYALRSGTALVYAHWEGAVRDGSKAYFAYVLEWVRRCNIKFTALSPNVAAMHIWLSGARHDATFAGFLKAYRQCVNEGGSPAQAINALVDTRSNLSYEAFADILSLLQIDPSRYASRRTFINERLVNVRNKIVHGEVYEVDIDHYLDCRESTLNLLAEFKNDLENYAIGKTFLRR